jgi:predicted nuclease of predicted toxin-antitoxin system
MARLLVDMNLSIEWISLLRAAGHEAVHWSEVGDPRAPDTVLMQWAIANGYAVFTHDLDFGTMLALSGADGPSVLQAPEADELSRPDQNNRASTDVCVWIGSWVSTA